MYAVKARTHNKSGMARDECGRRCGHQVTTRHTADLKLGPGGFAAKVEFGVLQTANIERQKAAHNEACMLSGVSFDFDVLAVRWVRIGSLDYKSQKQPPRKSLECCKE